VFGPDLVIIEPFDDFAVIAPGTVNATGVSPTTTVRAVAGDPYAWGLERMALAYRRKPTGCTVVHEIPNVPDNYVSDTLISTVYTPQNYMPQITAHRQVAAHYGHIISDTNQNWNELGVTYTFLTATNPHPNDAGSGTTPPAGSPPAYLNVQPRTTRWLGIGL
jgi:hypothetical protein